MKFPANRVAAFVGAAAVVIVGALAWRQYMGPPGGSHLTLEPAGIVDTAIGGPFSLVDQDGETITARDFRGRFMLVYFGYTYCPHVCATALTTITNALGILGKAGKNIVPLFITVDPERDTPEHLRMYVKYFHPRLVGLTGSPRSVAAAARAYRIYYAKAPRRGAAADDYLVDHTSIIYLMGPDGKFRANFKDDISAEALAKRIREFL